MTALVERAYRSARKPTPSDAIVSLAWLPFPSSGDS